MADDVKVTIGAESSGFSSEFQKVGKQLENLRNSGKKAAGMFEGDRRVENKLTAWVQGFSQARNSADLLANTLGNLGDVFRTSLAVGIGLNVGGALVQMFSDSIKKLDEMKQAAEEAGKALVASFDSRDLTTIATSLGAVNKEIEKLANAKIADGEQADAIVRLVEKRILAGKQLIEISALERKAAELRAEGHEHAAVAIENESRRIVERAKLEALNLPKAQTEKLMEDVEAGLQRKLDAAALEESTKRQIALEKERAAIVKANADAESEVRKEMEAEAERGDKERLERLDQEADRAEDVAKAKVVSEQKAVDSIISFHQQKWKDYWAWFQGELDKQVEEKKRKENEAALNQAKAQLPAAEKAAANAQELVDQVQGQRQAASAIGLFKSGASMGLQRAWQRFYQRQAENNAGVVARDEFRRKVGGDADKMEALKGLIEERKQQILGQAGKNNPEAKLEKAKADLSAIKTAVENAVRILGKK